MFSILTYVINHDSNTVSLAHDYSRTPSFDEGELKEGDIVRLHRHHCFWDEYIVVDRLKLDIVKDIPSKWESDYPGQLCLLDTSCY